VDCFIVKPFLVMASFSCLSVVELSGFIFTEASPFSRLTATESTPGTDFKDTRTACAHTSQSMPKIVISIARISAEAETTERKSTCKSNNSESVLPISNLLM
jgi:hypothetical protein